MAAKRELFTKVKFAREKLKAQAEELLDEYIDTIRKARAAGQYEAALDATKWLLEHMPAEDGERMIDVSVDKPTQVAVQAGPSISIGFALGGVPQPKQIEAPAIDVKVTKVGK